MTDKKIAVHVTNEEQWDKIREYYGNEFPYGHGLSYARNLFKNKELAQTSDNFWGTVACYHESNEYELLEFREWQARFEKHYKSLAEIQESIVNILKDITQATEEGDMTIKEFRASKIVLEQVAEELLARYNLEWHKEQVERRHSGFSTEFTNEKHTEELSYLETSLKPATKLAEVSKNTHLECNTTTRENIINTINRDAKEGYSESDFLLPSLKAEPSWPNAHTSVDMYLYIKDNESFTEELKNMGYRVFKSNPSVPTPYMKSENMSAYTIQWGK